MNVDAEQKCHNNVYMIEMYILLLPELGFLSLSITSNLNREYVYLPVPSSELGRSV